MEIFNKRYLLFTGSLLICIATFSQNFDPQVNTIAPKLIPATPNAASLTRYTGVNVNYNTGMVHYQVPVYDFQCHELSLPISASYQSGGFRVNEYPSFLGMTWALNAGGVITRKINGPPDENATRRIFDDSGYPYNDVNWDFITQFYNLDWLSGSDTEPDEFSFNFNGYNGKFVLDSLGNPHLLPHSNLKITTGFGRTDYTFIITAPDGSKYYFGGSTGTEYTYTNNTAYANTLPHPVYLPTSYYLVKVVSINGEEINLTYDDYDFRLDPIDITQSNFFTQTYTASSGSCSAPCPGPESVIRSYVYYHSKILRQINQSNYGSVFFNYTNYSLYNDTATTIGVYKTLDNIKVLNNVGDTVKRIGFIYDYIGSSSYTNSLGAPSFSRRPFLRAISDGPSMYHFKYESPENLPVFASFAQDHWGFFNGQSNSEFISNQGSPSYATYHNATADRNPYPAFAKIGILKRVSFPTGGYEDIQYEGNRSTTGDVGGIRVSRITTTDSITGTPMVKRIYYAPLSDISNNDLSGLATVVQLDKTTTYGISCTPGGSGDPQLDLPQLFTCTSAERSSSPVYNLNLYDGYHISYQYVTESMGGDNFENGGIEHKYYAISNDYPYPLVNGNAYQGPVSNTTVLNGKEYYTRIFRKDGASYVSVRDVRTHYKIDQAIDTTLKGFTINVRYIFSRSIPAITSDFDGFDVTRTDYHTQWVYVDSVISNDYSSDGSLSAQVVTVYQHQNSHHLGVTQVQTVRSNGKTDLIRYRYPEENAAPTGYTPNVYNEMVDSNFVAPVIRKDQFVDNVNTTEIVNAFNKYNSLFLLPSLIQEGRDSLNMRDKVTYANYSDQARLLQFQTIDGLTQSYIWDYQQTYPVASTTNAGYASTAYSGFEADGKGSWDYSTSGITEAYGSVTGTKSYTMSTGTIQRTALNSSITYLVTYWLKDGSGTVSVNSSSGTALVSKNGWTLYQLELTGVTTVTLSGTGVIDELRLYPKNAQMTTYSYIPLIGITSTCDVNNRITYYEYDVYGRLLRIRDADKNIIKAFNYVYQEAQ